jgi:hypothetical protein
MSDAIRNAQAWNDTICQALTALDRLQRDDTTPQTVDGETFDDADALRERIYEMPLAVSVRSDWSTPHDTLTPGEYQILLTTGGPALRIVGDLTINGEPDTARLEYQDWGTPWTAYALAQAEEARALDFASMFFFA